MLEQLKTQNQMNTPADTIQSPQAAEDLCKRVLQTTAELISVLDRETSMLRKGDTNELNSLIARKTSLSTTMSKDMTALNASAEYISRVVPEQLEALKDQHAQFQRSLRINNDALGAVKAISENLMRTIANAAGAANGAPEVYGNTAAMSGGTLQRPTALSVNRSL